MNIRLRFGAAKESVTMYRIGIDVGGTKVAYGLFDADGRLLGRRRHATPPDADGPALCDLMLDNIHSFLRESSIPETDMEGIGICMPSFILYDSGYIYLTSSITRIKDFPMRDYLRKRLDIPFVIDNDSNGAALAEYRYGAGKGSRDMVYMAVSTGIGSGLILNGQLYRGSYGWAGECGHMLITPDEGEMCGCENKGCFMSWASGHYIPMQLRRLSRGKQTSLDLGPSLSCETINDAVRAGDPLAIAAIEQTAHYIAVCAFNIYQLLNVNLFVFGGGLTYFGAPLFDRVRSEFDRYNHVPLPVEFRMAQLKQDFGIIGAAELVR